MRSLRTEATIAGTSCSPLTGQINLVTVVAIIVSSLAARAGGR
jgi:hypothetical protein